MRTIINCHAVILISLAQTSLCPLKAQVDSATNIDGDSRSRFHIDTVLYQGTLVHDQEWVLTRGTMNNQVLGVLGGTCSTVPSNISNVRAFERVHFKAEYQGFGVWKMNHTDTVVGTAIAETGERYRYTYNLSSSTTGVTINGKPPHPSRTMPTSTNQGFLEPVPSNIESATLKLEDMFLLLDRASGHLATDAHVLLSLHRAIDPSEKPPSFFPAPFDGYIASTFQTVSGQAGCDPL
jgi:hypothetical protein